jgi:hypothetical protein
MMQHANIIVPNRQLILPSRFRRRCHRASAIVIPDQNRNAIAAILSRPGEAGGGGGPALYDNSAEGFSTTLDTTLSTNSFAVGGSNRVLYVFVGTGAGSPAIPSTVKWNTTEDLTQISSTLNVTAAGRLTLWRLINPTATTGTVDVVWGTAQDERLVLAISVKDANQSTPETTPNTATGDGSSVTISVTATGVTSGQLIIDGQMFLDEGGGSRTMIAGGSQTSRQEIEGANTVYEGLGVSTLSSAGTSQAMSWTISSTWSGAFASFAFGVNGV